MADYRHPGILYREGADVASTGLSMREVQHTAAELGTSLSISSQPRIAELVEEVGGQIHYEDLDLSIHTGTIYVHGERDFDVLLPEFQPPTRERFTLAHELGHYILHSDCGRIPIIAPRLPAGEVAESRLEWEANWFAAGFLMPEALFREAFEQLGGQLAAVAAEFRVSQGAAEIRAKVLGLVTT